MNNAVWCLNFVFACSRTIQPKDDLLLFIVVIYMHKSHHFLRIRPLKFLLWESNGANDHVVKTFKIILTKVRNQTVHTLTHNMPNLPRLLLSLQLPNLEPDHST